MGWLRHVLIDLAVLVVIGLATFGAQPWALWVVWVYTPLMLLLKLGAVATSVTPRQNDVPDWFFHALYAVSVVILLYHLLYWEAAGWVAIWILSVVAASRQSRSTRPKKK
ncbi:MAG: hypothetical protein HKN29_05565 [Rhodothermales bacterium]|nr:hypothetical protein [Rhodothermales bacterium]